MFHGSLVVVGWDTSPGPLGPKCLSGPLGTPHSSEIEGNPFPSEFEDTDVSGRPCVKSGGVSTTKVGRRSVFVSLGTDRTPPGPRCGGRGYGRGYGVPCVVMYGVQGPKSVVSKDVLA